MKNYPLLKEEQEHEQFRKQGREQGGNSPAKRFSKAMLAAWGDSIEDEEGTEEEDACLLYTSPSPRDGLLSRMPSSA